MSDPEKPNPPPWADLVCPFRSTNHMIMPQQMLAGMPAGASLGARTEFQLADVPCIGQRCAIFYSCRPGEVQGEEQASSVKAVAEGGEVVGG